MRTAYAKNASQTTDQANVNGRHANIVKGKPAHRLRKTVYFALNRLMNPAVKVLLKCTIRLSIYCRWYAFRNFCTQIYRLLAYGVRISSKASASAGYCYTEKGSSYFLHRKNLDCVRSQLDHNASSACSHNALRPHSARVLSRRKVLFIIL